MKMKRLFSIVVALMVSLSSFATVEGLKPFKSKDNGKWGYKNDKGEIVIEPQYQSVEFFRKVSHCINPNQDK